MRTHDFEQRSPPPQVAIAPPPARPRSPALNPQWLTCPGIPAISECPDTKRDNRSGLASRIKVIQAPTDTFASDLQSQAHPCPITILSRIKRLNGMLDQGWPPSYRLVLKSLVWLLTSSWIATNKVGAAAPTFLGRCLLPYACRSPKRNPGRRDGGRG